MKMYLWTALKILQLHNLYFGLRMSLLHNFRKMLTLEQYRNTEMAELYSNCITMGIVEYLEDIFREMISKGVFKETDPKQLAVEFYAPMYLLINISDSSNDKEKLLERLNNHIERFIQHNAAKNLNND